MQGSTSIHRKWLQECAFGGTIGVVYFIAACISLELTQGVGGIATIWPASGIFVSALLLAGPGRSIPSILAVGAGSLAANMIFGVSIGIAAGFTLANLVEGVLISQLVIRTSGVPRTFDDRRWLLTFFGATVVGSATSGLIAAALAGGFGSTFFFSWFMTVCLGTLIVTPLIVTLASGRRSGNCEAPNSLRTIASLAAVCGATIAALLFSLQDERFLFLPVIGVIVAAFQFGSRGAAISISLISVCTLFLVDFTSSATGTLGIHPNTFFLQLYLLSLLCAAWPLTALNAEKARLIGQYAETNASLELAERTAKLGHWYMGPDNTSIIWSEEVYRIHGIAAGDFEEKGTTNLEDVSSLGFYHNDDRERVRTILLEAMANQQGFVYEARIVQPGGAIRHVSSVGHPQFDADGDFDGLFGTFQDVTDQAETLIALNAARQSAESEAASALYLAETDDLTGIPNRRKILARLRAASRSAERTRKPLTVAIVDIDNFKTVNDRHGHHIGDKVLERAARLMADQLRSSDYVGRFGGEEFLIIMPGENESSGFKIVERLRQRMASERWGIAGLSQVTMSAGIATFAQGEHVEKALQRADRALYAAKADGRNLLRAAA